PISTYSWARSLGAEWPGAGPRRLPKHAVPFVRGKLEATGDWKDKENLEVMRRALDKPMGKEIWDKADRGELEFKATNVPKGVMIKAEGSGAIGGNTKVVKETELAGTDKAEAEAS